MQAIIMAGGKGSRLRPLTDGMPKPLVKIIDKPVMEYVVINLRRAGVKDVAVTVGYRKDMIMDYFGDGRRWGLHLEYFEEDVPLGTAGGVKACEEYIESDFFVLSADGFCNLNLKDMGDYHRQKGRIATIAVKKLSDARGFGLVRTQNGIVSDFQEKPAVKCSGRVNTGIYAFKRDIFGYIPKGFADFSYDVFPLLKGEACVYKGNFFWSDIGTLPKYYSTNGYVCEHPSDFGVRLEYST